MIRAELESKPETRRDLRGIKAIDRALRSRLFQPLATLPATLFLPMVIVIGLWGVQDPGRSFTTLSTWIFWWTFLIFSIALFGRFWCLICPIGAVGEWLHRGSIVSKRAKDLGLNRRWPRRLRSLWPANLFLIAFLWFDNTLGIASSPMYTAYYVLILVAASAMVGLLFERRAFCRYLCPLTGFIGVQSMLAPFELRAKSQDVCQDCKKKNCYVGSAGGYGCPIFEFPWGMEKNTYCIYCTECIKTCPHNNIRLSPRPIGEDLWRAVPRRLDEAFVAVVILGLTSVGSALAATPLKPTLQGFGLDGRIALTIMFTLSITIAFLVAYSFCGLSRILSKEDVGTKGLLQRYGYALVPIGLSMFTAQTVDFILRKGAAFIEVMSYMFQDFPFGYGDVVQASPLASTLQIVAIQTAFIVLGHIVAVYVAYRVHIKFSMGELKSLFPIIALLLTFSLVNLWLIFKPLLF